MIEVDVVLLPDRATRRGRVDPAASIESAKKGILKLAKPGEDPALYDLFVVPRNRNPALSAIGVAPDDLIIISPREDLQPSFEWADD